MQKILMQEAEKYAKQNHRRRISRKIVRVMACVVAFCTTYALILPAITMEQMPCDQEEHTHGESCYEKVESEGVAILACSYESLGVHVHTSDCYDGENQLICGQADYLIHKHNDDCCDEKGAIVCHIPAVSAREHSDACYKVVETDPAETQAMAAEVVHVHDSDCHGTERGKLICQLTEEEGHTHGEGCNETVLVCDLTEESHVHGDGCYETHSLCDLPETEGHTHGTDCHESLLTCELREEPARQHTDECYEMVSVLVCGLEEGVVSVTTTETQEAAEQEPELICTEPVAQVHIHSDECFVAATTEEDPLTCTLPEDETHTHGVTCYGTWELICGKEEHTHDLACQSDSEADVETEADWMATFADVTLTGEWDEDLLAIARSQLGYQESTRNYEVMEDGETIKGYTRYGDWYGIPYGDWCAMFVSFCLNYADIPRDAIPYEANCPKWIEALQHPDFDLYRPAAEYTPVPGDLIFFDWEEDGISDYVGIVAELVPATEGEPAKIKTIEGNIGDCVAEQEYELDDDTILGYAQLPATRYCGMEEHTCTEEYMADAAEQSDDPVPECDCGNTSEIINHADSCTRKIYYRTLAEEKTAQEIYDVWHNLPAEVQTYILTYLEWNSYRYAEKLETLKKLIACSSFEVKAELDGCIFTVTGNIPESAELLVQDSQYDQETAYAFLNPNMWAEIHNYWVYDICIQVDSQAYQPGEPVIVTVYSPDFQVTEDEYFCVAHLDAEGGTILDNRYVDVQNNTITFEATGFSPYLFYTVDKSIDGGERVWGTNWMRRKESGFATYWQQFMTSNDSNVTVMSAAHKSEVLSDDQPSSQQIVNPGGTNSNDEDGVTVSKTIAGTDLENVFDITLEVTTTAQIQEVFQEPDMAVVLIMDISNTMNEDLDDQTKYEAAILAAEEFINQFAANNQGASTIGFVAFNTNAKQICGMQQCYTDEQAIAFKNTVRTKTSAIINNYGKDDRSRYTNIEAGLTMARDMLAGTDNTHRYIIFLSDGLPTTYLKVGSTSYKGYEPYTTSGTKNADGVFYDRINGRYIGYGSTYSDKGAIRAQSVAKSLKSDGVIIFAVGVGVDSFKSNRPSGVVHLNSTEYINDQLDRGGKTGAYAGTSSVSTVDNYVTSREDLAVGDITNDASGDVFKTWLRNSIGSGYYYNSANTTELQNAYALIFAELTRLNTEASISLWTVADPIPLANRNPETVEFIGLWTKPLPSELILNGSLTGACVENGENTAEFVEQNQMINWDLKNSGYVTAGSEGNMKFIYTLRYRVRLQNENENIAFIDGGTYPTNGETILRYQTIIKQNGNVSISDQKTIAFPIPSVKGWLGELSFTKIDSQSIPLAGAGFTLIHDVARCPLCRGDGCTPVSIRKFTGVSDENGTVSFSRIPSGHIYTLEETVIPDGYSPTGYTYTVQVAYDEVYVTVFDQSGKELENYWNGTIVNNFPYELPATGGSGTHLYTIGGMLLILLSAAYLLYKSKARRREVF